MQPCTSHLSLPEMVLCTSRSLWTPRHRRHSDVIVPPPVTSKATRQQTSNRDKKTPQPSRFCRVLKMLLHRKKGKEDSLQSLISLSVKPFLWEKKKTSFTKQMVDSKNLRVTKAHVFSHSKFAWVYKFKTTYSWIRCRAVANTGLPVTPWTHLSLRSV